MNVFSICFYKHSYEKFGRPFKVFNAHWKQSRRCKICGLVEVVDLGFVQAESID